MNHESVTEWIYQLISNKGVWRTAPATPGLLNISQYFTYMVTRLLPSWPMVKISTGPVHFRVTLDSLSGFPEPLVLKNYGKWNWEHLLDLVLFFHVFPDVLNFFQRTWHSQLYRCDYTCKILFFLKCLPHIWKLFGFNAGWHIFSYIYQSAVSCLGNEAQEIRKHIQKSTYSTNCSRFHFPEFLRARVLDTHQGYLKSI